MTEKNQNTKNERGKEERKQPKTKEAFVNEQVTKFFEIPIKVLWLIKTYTIVSLEQKIINRIR